MRRIVGVLKDYPGATTALVIVTIHWALYNTMHLLPDVAGKMTAFDSAWSIYLGFAGIVAISAGLTGVVVVFALGSTSNSFSRVRSTGGSCLAANWVSPVATSFAAAFGSAIAAVCRVIGWGAFAWWLFEFVFLLAATSSARLVWLFRRIVRVVADDRTAQSAKSAPLSME